MRVTVIPSDRWVRCDDVSAHLPSWSFDDSHIHAIQWYETEGEIEYTGRPKPANTPIATDDVLAPYLSALDLYLSEQTAAEPVGSVAEE